MTTILTILLGALIARPVFAHPGHGADWLLHGEPLVVAVVVAGACLAGWLAERRST